MIMRLAFSLLTIFAGTALAQATLDCGKYPTISTNAGPQCHRVGILPWFVGIPFVWETELRLGVGLDAVRFGYGIPSSYNTNLRLGARPFGVTVAEAISQLDLTTHASYLTSILGFTDYNRATGEYDARNGVGSLSLSADAQRGAALDSVSAFVVYKRIANGSVVSQTTSPVIFLDQAAVRWSAIITDTPRDQQSQPDSTITSFAVANLSPDPQAVIIQVYDEAGRLSASGRTTELQGGIGSGDVYASTLSDTLGINLPILEGDRAAKLPVFRGTVVFEGERGGLIAPVVFRFTGSAITSVPVKAE
jgi:hypothetical protein